MRTRFAPRRKPCADTARLSGLKRNGPISQFAHTATEARRWPHLRSNQPLRLRLRHRSEQATRARTCLVLQLVQPLSPLGDLCDVLSHDAHGIINLRLDGRRLRVSRASRVGRGAATGQVGVVRLRPARYQSTRKDRRQASWQAEQVEGESTVRARNKRARGSTNMAIV